MQIRYTLYAILGQHQRERVRAPPTRIYGQILTVRVQLEAWRSSHARRDATRLRCDETRRNGFRERDPNQPDRNSAPTAGDRYSVRQPSATDTMAPSKRSAKLT